MFTDTYRLAGDPAEKLERVRRAAAARRIIMRGDLNGGTFEGLITGSYGVQGDSITVNITKWPFFLSEAALGKQLRDFLETP